MKLKKVPLIVAFFIILVLVIEIFNIYSDNFTPELTHDSDNIKDEPSYRIVLCREIEDSHPVKIDSIFQLDESIKVFFDIDTLGCNKMIINWYKNNKLIYKEKRRIIPDISFFLDFSEKYKEKGLWSVDVYCEDSVFLKSLNFEIVEEKN